MRSSLARSCSGCQAPFCPSGGSSSRSSVPAVACRSRLESSSLLARSSLLGDPGQPGHWELQYSSVVRSAGTALLCSSSDAASSTATEADWLSALRTASQKPPIALHSLSSGNPAVSNDVVAGASEATDGAMSPALPGKSLGEPPRVVTQAQPLPPCTFSVKDALNSPHAGRLPSAGLRSVGTVSWLGGSGGA